jgi:hypothetical protein
MRWTVAFDVTVGAAEAAAKNPPAPKWAALGSDLVQAAADIDSGDSEKITTDGDNLW